MLVKTRAVVLDVLPYAEASVIVKAYTQTHGLQSFLVNGVRKPRARFSSNLFQPLNLIEVVAYFRKQGGLHRVAEVDCSPPLIHIPYDTVKTTIALFLAEILYRSIREEEANPELFGFIDHAVQILDLHPETTGRFHMVFCLHLTRYLGFYPGGRFSLQTPVFDLQEGIFRSDHPVHNRFIREPLSKSFDDLLGSSLDDTYEVILPAAIRKALLQAIISYYQSHLTQGFEVRSYEVLSELMS